MKKWQSIGVPSLLKRNTNLNDRFFEKNKLLRWTFPSFPFFLWKSASGGILVWRWQSCL